MALKGYPKELTLKDGKEVTIRPLEAEDGPALLEFFRGLPEEDRLFLREDVTRDDVIERYVTYLDYDKVLPLLAFHKGRVVGDGTLSRSSHGWKTHVGELRLVVARPFQRAGLGSALAKLLVNHAIDFGLEIMVAEIIKNQMGARKTLIKLGFKREAVLKGHVLDIHGHRRDLVILSNDVSHIWESMKSVAMDYLPSQE